MSIVRGGVASAGPKTLVEQKLSQLTRDATTPSIETFNMKLGEVLEVDPQTKQVKVKLYNPEGHGDVTPSFFCPVLTPLEQVHLLWGKLRPGLKIQFLYNSSRIPEVGVVMIIGDEDTDFFTKPNRDNIIATGPYKVFSGGLI